MVVTIQNSITIDFGPKQLKPLLDTRTVNMFSPSTQKPETLGTYAPSDLNCFHNTSEVECCTRDAMVECRIPAGGITPPCALMSNKGTGRQEAVDVMASAKPCLHDTCIVPVAMVTRKIDVWKKELIGDWNREFIVSGIEHGFSMVDQDYVLKDCKMRNYRSTTDRKEQVEKRLIEEIEAGQYIITKTKPSIVSALGAIPKDSTDVRLIHDLSRPNGGINSLAENTSVVYTSVDEVTSLLSEGSFLAKVDLKTAYRSIPVHKSCYDLTGLSWKFGYDTEDTFMFDSRIPFGAALGCKVFQSVADSICRMMARRNFKVRAYIDDLICIGDSEQECRANLNELILLLRSLGLSINWNKVCCPSTAITFLGVLIDCEARTLSLPRSKLSELKLLLSSWSGREKARKKDLQKLAGKLCWAARVIRGGGGPYFSKIDF